MKVSHVFEWEMGQKMKSNKSKVWHLLGYLNYIWMFSKRGELKCVWKRSGVEKQWWKMGSIPTVIFFLKDPTLVVNTKVKLRRFVTKLWSEEFASNVRKKKVMKHSRLVMSERMESELNIEVLEKLESSNYLRVTIAIN